MRYSAPCWPAARGPDRGGALQRLFGALYGEGYLNGCSNCTVEKRPPGGRSSARAAACKHALAPRGGIATPRGGIAAMGARCDKGTALPL